MSFLYNFGLSQEDERTEAKALRISDSDHIVCIASAGEMPLSLAAMGARKVTAVDVDPAQMALTKLKYAAVQTLPREVAIGFLGYQPMDKPKRRKLYLKMQPALPQDIQYFWDHSGSAIQDGVIWASRFERYMRWLRRVIVPLLGRHNIDGLFECRTIDEQRDLFDHSINRPYLRSVFRFAFEPKVFARRGMDPRSLAHRDSEVRLGDQYYGWFRGFCVNNLARENYFLQLTLLGRSIDTCAVPTYLSEDGYAQLKSQPDKVNFYSGDIARYLEETDTGSVDKFHLSNICDWLNQESFENVMRLILEKSTPGGRLVWRFLHVDRALPEDIADEICVEPEYGQQLRMLDRYPFYTIMPAQLIG